MKKYLKMLKTVSERREALNKYLSDTAPDKRDESRITELRGSLDTAESEFRTAVDQAGDGDDDPPERRELSDRIELRNYMDAAINGTHVTGAESEFNKEVGLADTGPTLVPWEALEERANEVDVPDSVIDKKRQPLLNRIFERTRVSFLGVRMPSVDMGEPVYPVMLTGAAGASYDEGGEVANEDATFEGHTLGPKRLSARYVWRLEQTTRFPIEDTLRADLRTVMGELLDKQILIGDGGTGGGKATDFDGLMRDHASGPFGIDVEAAGANAYDIHASTAATFVTGINSVIDYVDGKAASSAADVRTLIGVETYRAMAVKFKTDTGESIEDYIRSRLRSQFAVSSIVPVKANKYQQALQTRRPGDVVAPIWRAVSMIRDPYSGASKAETALTAHMLGNVIAVRKDHWRKVGYQLDA